MQTIRIEKRVPFGFKGQWGKVYKQFNYEEERAQNAVKWQKTAYADIGQDVQFKYLEEGTDKQSTPTQPVGNRVAKSSYRIVETTDAYFDAESGNFECVADLGDVIYLFGCWWTADSIDEKSIFTPAKQTFYYIALKRIKEKIIMI